MGGAGLFLPGFPEAAFAVAQSVVKPVLARWLGLDLPVWTAAQRVPLATPLADSGDQYLCLPAVRRGESLSPIDGTARGGLFGGGLSILVPPAKGAERTEGIVLDDSPTP